MIASRRPGAPGPAEPDKGPQHTGAAVMKTILIIGIGAGDPDYITVQAIKA